MDDVRGVVGEGPPLLPVALLGDELVEDSVMVARIGGVDGNGLRVRDGRFVVGGLIGFASVLGPE
ncbi:hypothetical protein [Streptomyces stelliscabiei]|uniref:hypothetical protein n=1 Tax=Streptomyces stelliscabiei TaxID=146820 RepID=UPI002FF35576